MFANLKLIYKLMLPIGVLVIATVTILWTAYHGIVQLRGATDEVIETSAERRALSLAVIGEINEASLLAKNVLLEPDNARRMVYQQRYQASIGQAIGTTDRLVATTASSDWHTGTEALKARLLEFQKATDKSVTLSVANNAVGAMDAVRMEGAPARAGVIKAAQGVVDQASREMIQAKSDINALGRSILTRLCTFAVVGMTLSLGLLAAVVILFIVRPLTGVTGAIQKLANGELAVEIDGAGRRDEVGTLARSLNVFKRNMIAAEALAAEQATERTIKERRTLVMEALVRGFESKVGGLVSMLSAGATELQATAQSMSSTASQTNQQATMVAASAEEASAGVQTVAAAAEELTASISEISRQVAHSATITNRAVADAQRTNVIVQALSEGAEKIGHVVGLISNIAGQTNLLALNATIEAARADDAGKGFAVVASEVKSLAQQTARATGEIGAQIAEIQSATKEAVDAIRAIVATITEVSSIATNIAAAVEEQGAATGEIARNVQQTAQAAADVTVNIGGVSQAANDTGAAASQVLGAATGLSEQSEQLAAEVDSFVAGVRVA